jgi:hypothetical protein
MAMVGMNGSPGVRNARAYRFCGCLEITRRMKMMERMRKMKINPKKEPLKPMASITSMKKIHKYMRPTSFVTNMPANDSRDELGANEVKLCHFSPLSSVAGPGLVQGKNPGHK